MPLKQTIAAIIKDGVIVTPQQDIELSLLEEAMEKARWAMEDHISLQPKKISKNDEHEWLISNGADYVKAQREQYAKDFATWQSVHESFVTTFKAAQAAFLKGE